jgi:hypothetical protein
MIPTSPTVTHVLLMQNHPDENLLKCAHKTGHIHQAAGQKSEDMQW